MKRGPKGDPNPQKGPLGDPGTLKGTHLGTVRCAVMLTPADGVLRDCSTCCTVIVEIATAETLAESLVASVRIPHLYGEI